MSTKESLKDDLRDADDLPSPVMPRQVRESMLAGRASINSWRRFFFAERSNGKSPSADSQKLGIRGLFRIAIIIVVACACAILSIMSYMNVTSSERSRAEASMRSEVNYLCLQLESLGNRADAFAQIVGASDVAPQELQSNNPEGFRLLSDPVGDILSGYTLAETGTVFIAADGTVAASDDERVPAGSDVRELLGDEVLGAVDASLASGEMQLVPYGGVFDEPGGAGAYGDGDEEAFLLAGRQGAYTVIIIEPTSMVFRDRKEAIGREVVGGYVVLIAVFLIVDRLLDIMVARRIDKMNEALGHITLGKLDEHVEEDGTREFLSLASGINVTVEALRGLIADAETRIDAELAAARSIQESALPRKFPPYPDIHEFDVYAIMDAAREVGGDFYDFFLISGSGPGSGKLAFLVADVSGKGIPAALFMMRAKALVRRELLSGSSIGQAVSTAHDELAEGNDSCMFVTMWVGVLNYGTKHVEYVNAGHNPPLFWRRGEGWRWLKDKSGLPLGVGPKRMYKTFSFDCLVGDTFLLYTDGVNEANDVDGGRYGDKRLEAVATMHADEHPEALVRAVRADVDLFAQGAEQFDDITILALEVGEAAAAETTE